MSKDKISDYSTTPGNNTDIGGINIDENCSPANLNNAIRELMSQLREFQTGAEASNQLSAAGGGTGLTSPGTSGNVLTSDGTGWTSATPTYVPAGALLMWGTATAPTGYLLCNGSAVSRSTYAALFAVVGTTFGSGDGSTTFNLPDYRNRFPVGAGTTYSANSSGGSADAITVSHTHTATSTDAGHTHSTTYAYQTMDSGAGTRSYETGPYNLMYSSNAVSSGTASITTTISTTGSSGTNANLPPYLGIYFIIKT